ncbi:MAG TPA: hypothetical protein VG370_24530 [Chloroflexota bacterium]|jgi:hypothetical protein|nr:hypothetical protein [Chloroflexota bacterium]
MSQPHNHSSAEPTIERALLGGLVGAGVAVLCLIPPVVHFISGPLGPLIGGAIGGARSRATGLNALVVGLTIGVLLAVIVPALGMLLEAILPVRFPEEALFVVGAGVFVYSTLLGWLGALIGAWFARGNERPVTPGSAGTEDQPSA